MSQKHLHVGPGGLHCACCFPAPGSKDRRSQFRRAKRKADREAMQEAFAEIEDDARMQREIEEVVDAYDDEVNDYSDWLIGQDPYFEKDPYWNDPKYSFYSNDY